MKRLRRANEIRGIRKDSYGNLCDLIFLLSLFSEYNVVRCLRKVSAYKLRLGLLNTICISWAEPTTQPAVQNPPWEAKTKASYWNNTPRQRQAKLFIKYSKKRASELLLHNKKDLRTLVGLYTGHCPLKYYLYKLGQTNNATCRLCKGAEKNGGTHTVYMRCNLPQKAAIPRKGEPHA